MKQLQRINIKNFRKFKELEIDNFKQINVFIGNNNSGKSSILESIFLLIGMSNPTIPDVVHRIRSGSNLKNNEDFRYLFHNLEIKDCPEMSGSFMDKSGRNLRINPIIKKIENIDSNNSKQELSFIDISTATPKISGIELDFTIHKKGSLKRSYKSTASLNFPEVRYNQAKDYIEDMRAIMISPRSDESTALERFADIVKKKKEKVVLEALQNIDPKIDSIQPLPDGLYFSYKDIEELVPSNISGDGIRKILNIVTAVADERNSIVLIDEIENGLHFSAHKFLWESIIHISRLQKTQLFITSHNIETLKCLKELLDTPTYKETQNQLNIFTVADTKKSGVKTYRHSYIGLKDAIETATEIRR